MTPASRARLRAGAAAACVLMSAGARAADYVVVINNDNAVASLDRRAVSALFLRRVSEWEAGTPALPVDGPNSPAREAFSKDVHGKKAAAVRSHWLQVIFSGRGVPPPEKASDKDVLDYVKAHPGAIGYVSSATAITEVKVLEVDP